MAIASSEENQSNVSTPVSGKIKRSNRKMEDPFNWNLIFFKGYFFK